MNKCMDDSLVVSVCMITYNHEAYISQAIDSILMQKTTFKYELVLSDDCSTDNTRIICEEYCRKYPDIIKNVSPKKNLGALGNSFECLSSCSGKYIATCEGDDYWIDPLKLQKQVDFLEKNVDYGMCYTKAKHYYQSKMKFRSKDRGGANESFIDFLRKNTVPTLTVVFRTDLYHEYLKEIMPEKRGWSMGDYPLWLWIAYNSKIKFLPEVTGVYRILLDSASHSSAFEKNVAFVKSTFDIKEFFYKKYPQQEISIDDIQQELYQRLFSLSFSFRRKDCLKKYYKLIKRKTFSVYVKFWIRRFFWGI